MSQDLELAFTDQIITDLKALEYNETTTKVFNNVRKYYTDPSEFQANNAILDLDRAFNETNTNQEDLYRMEYVVVQREAMTDADQSTANTRIDRQYNVLQALREYITEIPNNLGIINGYQILDTTIVNARIYYRKDEISTDRVLELTFAVRGKVNVRNNF